MGPEPLILWIGKDSPSKAPPGARMRVIADPSEIKEIPMADLTVVRWSDPAARSAADLLRRLQPEAPLAFSAPGFGEEDLRLGVNRFAALRFLTDDRIDESLHTALVEALRRRQGRNERDRVMQEFTRRNRELESLTEKLEKAVVERTGVLEESTKEEKDKLARERQLIRFLNEISLQNSTEDILRVLRRELRRFHKIQNLMVALREPGQRTEFLSFRGDQVVLSEGIDELPLLTASDLELRQFFANHFGRPFNRTLFFPFHLRFAGEGLLGVEYSLMSDEEIREISDLLQERLRPAGMGIERLFLEDRLRRFAGRWERTFDGLRDPISVVDAGLQVLRGNRAFSTGFRKRKCFEAFAARTTPCEGCPVGENPESEETLEGTVHVGRRVYRLSSWPVKEPGMAKISGRVTHYSDITESRELYLHMLQNEKMSAIGSLAGHIAHELNNPLTGIRSLAQALNAEAEDEGTLKEDLAHIESAARRCQNIIRHLLDFTNDAEGTVGPVSVDEIVERTLPLLKSALRRHRLELDLQAREAAILADAHLLQQVVFNLINNACQAMKDPGRIVVSSKLLVDGLVELRICDTGPGIPDELKVRLFEPFFTTKKEGEGTGLGLSTSKAIVEKFGGKIRFESEVGKGTEFILSFERKGTL